MKSHRIWGFVLIVTGLVLVAGQLTLLYGGTADQALMLAIGLPGVAVLSAAASACFGIGCLLAAAPHATVLHMRRAADAIRRRKSS